MADIAPGYTFTAGETNVDHTKLNNAASGSVNTTFHTGKASAGANPNSGTTEVMVYDTVAAGFKKGTLSSLFLDHTGLLSARSAKTVPVAADATLIADSAASGALKQMTLANVLFGAAAHGAPLAADKIPIYDSAGTAIKTVTLQNLISIPALVGSIDGSESFPVITAANNLRHLTLSAIATNATALTSVGGINEQFPIFDAANTLKRIQFGQVFRGNTAITSPASDSTVVVTDTSANTRKITTLNLKLFFQTGYALYRDEKASGTVGGTLTAGSWQTRVLNTESVDNTLLGASVAANQVQLLAGTYRFRGVAPFYKVGNCVVRLQNVTDATTTAVGTVKTTANSANTAVAQCEVSGRFTIAGTKLFELQYQIQASASTSDGGAPGTFGVNEVYSTLEFWQED